MHRRLFLVRAAALSVGCAAPRPPAATLFADGKIRQELVPARLLDGFNFPYILQTPAVPVVPLVPYLLVEPNNTGRVSLDYREHVRAASALAHQGFGGMVARRLGVPLLVPVFPRGPGLYTHSLGRQTLLSRVPELRRLDRQLLEMSRDAIQVLRERGQSLRDEILLSGFSASAKFVTRLTALHPRAISAVAAGGLNGFVILPKSSIGSESLRFPLGTADLAEVSGSEFDAASWRRVPQLLFMGGLDTNDAVEAEDSYSDDDRRIIHSYLGRKMMPDRWLACEREYAAARAHAKFATYSGLGHGTDRRVHDEVAAFFAQVAAR